MLYSPCLQRVIISLSSKCFKSLKIRFSYTEKLIASFSCKALFVFRRICYKRSLNQGTTQKTILFYLDCMVCAICLHALFNYFISFHFISNLEMSPFQTVSNIHIGMDTRWHHKHKGRNKRKYEIYEYVCIGLCIKNNK